MIEAVGDYRYTKTHEWVRRESDGILTVGITAHAEELLGDIVYVQLPQTELNVIAGEGCCVVESVKAASDIYAPVTGTIRAVNERLAAKPELINHDPYGEGWIFHIHADNANDFDALMDSADYATFVTEEDN